MDVNQQKGTVAHLRKNYFTKNCELNFSIKTELPGLSLSEEIQIILNKYEKISHLISHIEQELRKLLQTKFDKNVEQIHVAFKSGINNVNNDILLANFPGALVNNNEPVILEVFDQKYMLSFNDPIVKDMKIPPILFANYSVQPVRFLTIFTDRKSCKFTWYKSLDKVEWIECGKGYDYQVQLEDVGHYLKLVCIPSKKDRKDGPMAEAISQFKVQIMEDLPTFPFEKRHEFTKNYSDDREFRVVSYNILSERYTLMDENYSYCEPKFLSIDYRKQIIMKELLGFKAEIICLQEVDNRHFINFFRDQFKRNGYYCYYHKKGNRISEGFAMIFKKSHFKIISSILEDSLKQLSHLHCVDKKEINSMHIVFGLEVLRNPLYSYIWKVIKKNEDLKNEFMKMPTSLQVAVLKCRREKNYLIVGNTHFTYKPESNHLRLLHINMAIAYLEFLRIKYSKESSNVAVILCGDFNSQPDQSLYEYVTKGKIDPYHEDCSKVNENGIIPMFHKLGMESACGTPKFTNYTTDFKGCLDYIFIESAKLEIRRVVPLTKEEELTKHEGLPNEFFPSDHLPLVVDLRFKLQSDF